MVEYLDGLVWTAADEQHDDKADDPEEHIRVTTYHGIHLLGCHRLPVFSKMQALPVYLLGNLFSPHTMTR